MNYAIILSGGTGTRLGLNIPKQYYEINGKPIIHYTLETLSHMALLDGYVIVAAEEWRSYLKKMCGLDEKFLGFAEPGENRQLSIYHGLLALRKIAAEADVVLIQDAARPNTTEDMIAECFGLLDKQDGAMPVLPMKDTVYLSENGKQVTSLLQRNQIFAGQAPESFRYGKYLRANEALLPEKILHINGSTEPAILAGMQITMITGDEKNYKITTVADLERFCGQIEDKE